MARLHRAVRFNTRQRCKINKNKNGAWVISQADFILDAHRSLILKDCLFEVDLKIQSQVQHEKRRGPIHAYISGYFCRDGIRGGVKIDYNPFGLPYFFIVDTMEPVLSARYVRFETDGVYAIL